MRLSLAAGCFNDRPRFNMSAHRSPLFFTRAGMLRSVNDAGATLPFSISSHVHGADTGARGLSYHSQERVIHGQLEDPGHGGDFVPAIRAVTDKERQDEPGRIEPMLANQGTNAG